MELAFKSAVELLRRPFVLKFSFAILTQSLLSLTNLIIGIVIAKYASKSEYGMYVILFSIIGLVGNYQGAIVNTPLTVLLPAKNAQEKQVFFFLSSHNHLYTNLLFSLRENTTYFIFQ